MPRDRAAGSVSYRGALFDVCYVIGNALVGEGHRVIEDPTQRPGMTAAEIIDRLG